MNENHLSVIPLTNRCENFLRHSHSSETSERNHIDFANYKLDAARLCNC